MNQILTKRKQLSNIDVGNSNIIKIGKSNETPTRHVPRTPSIQQSETANIDDELMNAVIVEQEEKKLTCSPMTSPITPNSPMTPISKNNKQTEFPHYVLFEHGLAVVEKICNTLQGEIFEGEIFDRNKMINKAKEDQNSDNINILAPYSKIQKHGKKQINRVVIKKSHKALCNKNLCVQDNMNIIVEENIAKEAVISYHLTIENKPTGDYLSEFVNFFESENHYYLVMEYISNVTLRKFAEIGHQHIKNGKLAVKEWKKIIKYIFWQLIVVVHWLHNDMHCCHLDISLDNIMIQNGEFIKSNSGDKVSINPKLTVKLIDFGLSEIFAPTQENKENEDDAKIDEYFEFDMALPDTYHDFHCFKHEISENQQLKAPKVFSGDVYDARKSDIYSLGIVLLWISIGAAPYQKADCALDAGYRAIKYKTIGEWLQQNRLAHLLSGKLLLLLYGLLDMDETKRFNTTQILQHEFVRSYFKKYQSKIVEKSRSQRTRNIQRQKYFAFPYYRFRNEYKQNYSI